MKSSSPTAVKLYGRVRKLMAGMTIVTFLFAAFYVVHSQNPSNPTLRGESNRVLLVPKGTVNAGEVKFKPDSDHDGMTDEDEENNGTNPNDPSDADGDPDNDGVSNGDEVGMGTNPNVQDSDGDGFSDSEEIRLGYNPLDPDSHPGATPAPLQITPNPVSLIISATLGQEPVQLKVTRTNSNGTIVDLTTAPGTTYSSTDSNVAVVDDFGLVAGLTPGETEIVVQNGASTGQVAVTVSNFTAGPLSSISIPGYANSVELVGDYAFVAAGNAGLQVVNVSDRSAPFIAGSLDTAGNANDVKVVGNTAYVADGPAGLQIVDISNPASPALLGTADTPGNAQEVAISGGRAVVADRESGVQIIDVSNSPTPTIVGATDMNGYALAIDVSGDLAVVIVNFEIIAIVNFANPGNPQVVGTTTSLGRPTDLKVRDRFAYIAALNRFVTVDFSVPSFPRVIANTVPLFVSDVALFGRYAVNAGITLGNNPVYVVDLANPSDPTSLGDIQSPSPPLTRFFGTGIALDSQHFYWTGAIDSQYSFFEAGTTGQSRLFIGNYSPQRSEQNDTGGIAPTVSIDAPQNGQSAVEGNQVTISAAAIDDVQVSNVRFSVNGTVVITDFAPPFQFAYTVPLGFPSLTITATAVDLAGNQTTSAPVTINVLPEPPPTVTIITPAEGQILTEGQEIHPFADADDDGGVAQVVFNINGETLPNGFFYVVPTGITSLTFEATATDNLGKSASTTRTVTVVPDPPPTITIVSPADGTQLTEAQVVEFSADASDNTTVSFVEFTINGQVFSDSQAPYRQTYTIPVGTTSLFLEAAAIDNFDQRTAASRTFTVVPDAGTTVTGRALDTSAQPVSGATAKVGQLTAQTGADGSFTITNVPTAPGNILVRVTATIGGISTANASLPTPPVPGGTTDVGVVTLSVAPTAPTAFAVFDYNGNFVPDVFVGYPDRQSSIYSFGGGQFTPNASLLLPYGSVNSGASLEFSFGSREQIFSQLSGRPGSVTEVTFDSGAIQAPRTVATGLVSETEYTAVGLDITGQSNNRQVLAFLKNGSGGTSLTVRFGNDSLQGYTDPLFLPVDSSAPLRSLTVVDVNSDGLQDLLVLKPITGTDAKLVVYKRTSASTFGGAIETSVIVRATVPSKGVIDFVVGRLATQFTQTDIAVLGDDRVRIYRGDGSGAFVFVREIVLPAGRIVTGITAFDVSRDQRSDIIVTTRVVSSPTSKSTLIYFNTSSGIFQPPITRFYTAPVNAGDTRAGFGDWGGNFQSADMVVVDGATLIIFLDVGPTFSGS